MALINRVIILEDYSHALSLIMLIAYKQISKLKKKKTQNTILNPWLQNFEKGSRPQDTEQCKFVHSTKSCSQHSMYATNPYAFQSSALM